MLNRISAFILLCIFIASCSDSGVVRQDPIVGQWIVSEVHYDGIQQTGWNGAHLTFHQERAKAGNFAMTDTPYDSIWSSNGTWRISTTPSELVINETLTARFQADPDQLIVAMHLPWTEHSTCVNGICTTMVTGDWMFKFERD